MKYALSLILLSLIFFVAPAQDTLVKLSGETIVCKILEVNSDDVKYNKLELLNGPLYSINRKSINYIIYQDGSREDFAYKVGANYKAAETLPNSMDGNYYKGYSDAEQFYRGYKGAATVTFIASLIYPLVGLVPAIITSTTPPRVASLTIPSKELWDNNDYRRGYLDRAKKIKQNKVWKNFGLGILAEVLLYGLLLLFLVSLL